jgi:NitT/TauT family transport system substrate-binding protein
LAQGCIVVRTEWAEAHPKELEEFLSDYKASIEYTNSNAADAAAKIVELEIFAGKAPVAEKAIPNCNITYIDGDEMAEALDKFFTELHKVAPASVGGKVPDGAIYYKK